MQPEMIAEEAQHEAEGILAEINVFAISTNDQYAASADKLKEIKAAAKRYESQRTELVGPLNATVKRINDLFRAPLDTLAKAESTLKRAMIAWQSEVDRKRREAEKIAQEVARKEQERLDKIAEAKAAKAEEKGNEAKAEAIREAVPVVVSAPVHVEEPPKVSGVSMRQVWKFRVVDSALIPREYLLVNEKMLGDLARATKGAIPVPGVEFYAENTMAAGGR